MTSRPADLARELLARIRRCALPLPGARFAEPMEDEQMNRLLEQQGELQAKIDAVGGWEVESKLEIASDALRLPPWDAPVATLSGGERRRVALCRLLLSEPDMLRLDEPTNHLDALSVQWLEQFLARYPGTVVAVIHDRYFLDNVAGWILELDRGCGIPWEGNYSTWLEQKEKRLEFEAKQEAGRTKAMRTELKWVRSNPKARQAKTKARLARFAELESPEFQKRNETNEIYIPPGPRLGSFVVEAEGLRKSFGDKLSFDGLSFRLPPGGVVGVIGPNGAGKTTLFRMLAGQEKPDSGTLRALEEALLDFPGCAVFISHDRWFLDRIATHVLAFEGGSQAVWFPGNYAAHVEDRRKRLGEDADKPHRIRYRPLLV